MGRTGGIVNIGELIQHEAVADGALSHGPGADDHHPHLAHHRALHEHAPCTAHFSVCFARFLPTHPSACAHLPDTLVRASASWAVEQPKLAWKYAKLDEVQVRIGREVTLMQEVGPQHGVLCGAGGGHEVHRSFCARQAPAAGFLRTACVCHAFAPTRRISPLIAAHERHRRGSRPQPLCAPMRSPLRKNTGAAFLALTRRAP